MEFEHHLFQLITRIVRADYARHSNVRREFSPDMANTHYVFTHVVTAADTLSKTFRTLGIVNSFFIKLGIIQGENHLGDLCRQFHFPLFGPDILQDPPLPDMRMLSFHAAMDMIEGQFEGDVWKFASHFRRYEKHDI